MRKTVLLLVLLAETGKAQNMRAQDTAPAVPPVINSTYVVKAGDRTLTFHLREEDGRLTVDEKLSWGSMSDQSSGSLRYEKVNYVSIDFDSPDPDHRRKRAVDAEDSEGKSIYAVLPTESDAEALAEYVARKASLEWLGNAWGVRKPFQCPEDGQPGCRDFKELLDHNDPEIAGYFYSRDKSRHTYACFSNEERQFSIVQYSTPAEQPIVRVAFFLAEFLNGQSGMTDVGDIEWSSGDSGRIFRFGKDKDRDRADGWVDSSSLAYVTEFPNRMNTTTHYTLDLRLSTGRYAESYSTKDGKGKDISSGVTGVCARLN